jgi:hypothetical protein
LNLSSTFDDSYVYLTCLVITPLFTGAFTKHQNGGQNFNVNFHMVNIWTDFSIL